MGEGPQFRFLDHPIADLNGKTLVLVGAGSWASVAVLARAFGMKVVRAERPGGHHSAGLCSLEAALGVADVVSLHCPLTPETRGLLTTLHSRP